MNGPQCGKSFYLGKPKKSKPKISEIQLNDWMNGPQCGKSFYPGKPKKSKPKISEIRGGLSFLKCGLALQIAEE